MNAEQRIEELQQEVNDLKGQLKKTNRTLDHLFIASGRAEQIARENAFVIFSFQNKLSVEEAYHQWKIGNVFVMSGVQEIMNGKETEYFRFMN